MIPLTPKQRQCAEGLLRAERDKEIAARMGVAPRTVKNYVALMTKKFLIDSSRYHARVKLAMLLHQCRNEYGIRCEGCK